MKSRLIVSDNYASKRSNQTRIEYNKNNVYGKIYQHIRVGLRSRPSDSAYLYAKTGRETCYFKVMGKIRDGNNKVWYYVELKNNIEDYDIITKKAIKGTKVFFSAEFGQPVITVKFDKFLADLRYWNAIMDVGNTSFEDSLKERITRFRQLGHKRDVELFDKVIGHSVDNPVYLDDIPYLTGVAENILFSNGDSSQVDTKIQMFKDYSAVEFSNGKCADIQHLFVGLDVLSNVIDPHNFIVDINLGLTFHVNLKVGNNAYSSLFCGDAGAALGDWQDDNVAPSVRESFETMKIGNIGQEAWFYETRLPIEDRVGNVFCFGLNELLKEQANVPNDLEIVFKLFNSNINQGSDKKAINKFADFIGFNRNEKLNSSNQPNDKRQKLSENTYLFYIIWYYYKNLNIQPEFLNINHEPEESTYKSDHRKGQSDRLIGYFLNSVDSQFSK